MDLYKRIIFCLYFKDNSFYLSRNFSLQKVGNLEWLIKNFGFGETSNYIDELIIILVKQNPIQNDLDIFLKEVSNLKKKIFIPIILGGQLRDLKTIKRFFDSGADKILINTLAYNNNDFINQVAYFYGSQAVSIMIDYKKKEKEILLYSECGTKLENLKFENHLMNLNGANCGEIILNSIDNDGNGSGLDFPIMNNIDEKFDKPLLLMGGAGKPEHFYQGLSYEKVNGIITANLFNFLGSGLKDTRNYLINLGIRLAKF